MKFRILFLGCVFLAVHASAGFAQRDFSSVTIKAKPVAGNVYALTGQGGNIGVSVGDDGILIIDDQFAPLAEKIRSALTGLSQGDLKFILNTHWHGDHVGGNPIFGREATIIAHDNVRKRVSTKQFSTFSNREVDPLSEEGWPVITFDDSLSIHFNDEEIKVVHFSNGHTDGDSVIFFTDSKVVHMGDHFFNGMFPFVDLGSGGNAQGYTDNVGAIVEMVSPDTKIIPGHGPLATYQDLRDYHQMLVETTSIVRQKIKESKTKKQIQQEGFPDSIVAQWGGGFISTEKWINTIYESYAQSK